MKWIMGAGLGILTIGVWGIGAQELSNGSFEQGGEGPDRAAGWHVRGG